MFTLSVINKKIEVLTLNNHEEHERLLINRNRLLREENKQDSIPDRNNLERLHIKILT